MGDALRAGVGRLSLPLEGGLRLAALEVVTPRIFNGDQGSPCTSDDFTGRLQEAGVAISWGGRGRALDNVFVQRLWRSVKYEEVYLKDYADVHEARRSLEAYFEFYNRQRPHQALDYRTPQTAYRGTQGVDEEAVGF